MIPPEPLEGPAPVARPVGSLSAEQLHRHLVARVAVALEQLRALEAQQLAPVVLVTSVGATVVEAQRLIDAERTESELRSEAFGRVAARRGGELMAEAEAEARILRAVATWLRLVSASAFLPMVPTGAPSVAASTVVAPPVLAALEARAS